MVEAFHLDAVNTCSCFLGSLRHIRLVCSRRVALSQNMNSGSPDWPLKGCKNQRLGRREVWQLTIILPTDYYLKLRKSFK